MNHDQVVRNQIDHFVFTSKVKMFAVRDAIRWQGGCRRFSKVDSTFLEMFDAVRQQHEGELPFGNDLLDDFCNLFELVATKRFCEIWQGAPLTNQATKWSQSGTEHGQSEQ